MSKLRHYFRRMKYLAWVEWLRIVKEVLDFNTDIYLVSQRDLTEEEYNFPSTAEFQARLNEFTDHDPNWMED